MSTPFQKYLLEAIKDYDTPPGVYYDPIRDQSVKGDDPFDFDEVLPKPNLGPRPEFDFEADLLNNDPNFLARVLIHFLGGEYPDEVLARVQGILFKLPENVEDWQEYFDRVIAGLLKPLGFFERGALNTPKPFGPGGIEGIIETLVDILNDLLDSPFGGSEYLQWHFNQYLQQLIDFLNDYEYGG
tara:strand:+ start:188 stop:742 length:555 start_codon:yes stop_codon:yes gene_type:complete